MAEMEYMNVNSARFRLTPGGLLSLEIGDKFYPKVDVHLAFPFSWPNRFISIWKPEGDEIGLIEDLSDLDANSQEALKQELNWRYYIIIIKRIISYKEEFGHAYWEVDTDRGQYKFVTRRRDQSVRSVSAVRVLIADVSGNRFEIEDITKLDNRSRFYLETLL